MVVKSFDTWFVSLEEIGADQSYGAKVANIGALSQAGFKVPHSWAIRVGDVDQLLNMDGDNSQAILENFCSDARLRDAVYGLVVRSSFVGEDEAPESSFAGVFESAFVARQAAELRDGLVRCLDSLRRTLPYDSAKLSPNPCRGGILIQTAIRPLLSGVYFSHAPFDTMSDCIEATRGLSIGINSGLAEPIRFQQPRTASIDDCKLDEFLGRQQAVVLLPASPSDLDVPPADFISYGGRWNTADKVLAHVPGSNLLAVEGKLRLGLDLSIADDLLRSVRALGWNVCTNLMRSAVDVEWCADETGAVWIVQARRVPNQPETKPPMTSGNIGNERWLGTPASAGSATGRALVVRAGEAPSKPEGQYVLILDSVEQMPVELLLGAGAIVSRDMGLLSHTAILARELCIPCVIDAHGAADNVRNGDVLYVVGEQGVIERALPSGASLFASAQSREAVPRHPFAEFHYILDSRGSAASAHRCRRCLVYETADEACPERRCSLDRPGHVAGCIAIDQTTALASVHWTKGGPPEFLLWPRYEIGTLCFLLSTYVDDPSVTEADTCCPLAVAYRIAPRLDLLK